MGSGGSGGLSGRSMWSPGTEYTYEYQGRLLTGIPELSSHHFSGVGIKCKLSLTVTRHGRLVLQIREAEYARVNNVRLRYVEETFNEFDTCNCLSSGPRTGNW